MVHSRWARTALIALLTLCLAAAAMASGYTTLRYKDNGDAVLRLQQALNKLGYGTAGADGKYGPTTRDAVRSFQKDNRLKVDGVAGNETQTLLFQLAGGGSSSGGSSSGGSSSSGVFGGNYATMRYGAKGARVRTLQKALNDLGFSVGKVDGTYGLGTQNAVQLFQKSAGLSQDGKAGRNTLTAIERALKGDLNVNPAPQPTPPTTEQNGWQVPTRTLRKGARGEDVKSVQSRLKELGYYTGSLDGNYGTGSVAAVRAFQERNGLKADGLAGSGTYKKLFSTNAIGAGSSATPETEVYQTLRRGSTGDAVRRLQKALKELNYPVNPDGVYGDDTIEAVEAFQRINGLSVDGAAGQATQVKLYSGTAKPYTEGGTGGTGGTVTDEVLRVGATGDAVRALQKALKALNYPVTPDGVYGSDTMEAVMAFQRINGLTVDGAAGKATQTKLYSGNAKPFEADTSGSDSSSTTIAGPNGSRVQLLHWFKDVKPSLRNGQRMEAYDPATGISWTLRIMSCGRHADVEPLTAEDTAKMFEAFGGKEDWGPKVVYVKLPDGRWSIAATHNVAHGGQTINGNNFDGQNCVHFLRDMDECAKNDPSYGVQNQKAIRKSWKNLTGEVIN